MNKTLKNRDLFSVSPAHAGVIPTLTNQIIPDHSEPRTRGGDPRSPHRRHL